LLVRCQPKNVAVQTGFDAFGHAFELYVSRIFPQLSQASAYRAIKLIAKNLREFAYNRGNHVACENMVWVTDPSGSDLAVARLVLYTDWAVEFQQFAAYHHGFANAVIIVPAERYNQIACPDKFAEMAETTETNT
jgi:alcohol dehydrogenase class IV